MEKDKLAKKQTEMFERNTETLSSKVNIVSKKYYLVFSLIGFIVLFYLLSGFSLLRSVFLRTMLDSLNETILTIITLIVFGFVPIITTFIYNGLLTSNWNPLTKKKKLRELWYDAEWRYRWTLRDVLLQKTAMFMTMVGLAIFGIIVETPFLDEVVCLFLSSSLLLFVLFSVARLTRYFAEVEYLSIKGEEERK